MTKSGCQMQDIPCLAEGEIKLGKQPCVMLFKSTFAKP